MTTIEKCANRPPCPIIRAAGGSEFGMQTFKRRLQQNHAFSMVHLKLEWLLVQGCKRRGNSPPYGGTEEVTEMREYEEADVKEPVLKKDPIIVHPYACFLPHNGPQIASRLLL